MRISGLIREQVHEDFVPKKVNTLILVLDVVSDRKGIFFSFNYKISSFFYSFFHCKNIIVFFLLEKAHRFPSMVCILGLEGLLNFVNFLVEPWQNISPLETLIHGIGINGFRITLIGSIFCLYLYQTTFIKYGLKISVFFFLICL